VHDKGILLRYRLLTVLSFTTLTVLSLIGCKSEKKQAGLEFAPEFTLMDPDSVLYTLGAIKGDIIMVHFWADWCPHCRKEFSELQAAYDSLKGPGFNLVAINSGQTRDIVEGVRNAYNLTFPMLMDPEKKVTGFYNITGLPTTFVIDADRRILKRTIGWLKKEDVFDLNSQIRTRVD
jgi:peroxiredoxin